MAERVDRRGRRRRVGGNALALVLRASATNAASSSHTAPSLNGSALAPPTQSQPLEADEPPARCERPG